MTALTGRPSTKRSQTRSARSALAQQHAVAGQRLRVGIALGNRPARPRRSGRVVGRLTQRVRLRLRKAAPPGLVGEAQRPVGLLLGHAIRRSRRPFFGHIPDRGW